MIGMKEKKDVLQGTLALMVLKTLDVLGPLHGYAIARRIEQISGDLLSVNQGTLATNLAGHFSDVQNFLQSSTNGFANNLDALLTNLADPSAGTLGLDAKSLAQTSQDLGSHISDLQSNLAVKQANLILVYSQVNTTLQELPLLQQQLSRQLGSF